MCLNLEFLEYIILVHTTIDVLTDLNDIRTYVPYTGNFRIKNVTFSWISTQPQKFSY